VCRSLRPAYVVYLGKKIPSLAESDQRVRHGEQVQPCLMRSHADPEDMREPGSASMECPLVRELPPVTSRRRSYKINHRHLSAPFASYFAGVMQDKGLPNLIERICTTLLIQPVMSWHDMYSIYILL
jgi:hypothetical protein